MPSPSRFRSSPSWPLALLLCIAPFLSGCFEISSMHGEAQALNAERLELEKYIPAYDQHIAYYRALIPWEAKIVGGTDPYYEPFSEYLHRVESELTAVKVRMAATSAHLKILREETAREHGLQPSE